MPAGSPGVGPRHPQILDPSTGSGVLGPSRLDAKFRNFAQSLTLGRRRQETPNSHADCFSVSLGN